MEENKSVLGALVPSFFRGTHNSNQRRGASEDGDVEGQSDPDPTKRSYARRRLQVRRAQKKHREKKANYVFALEQEVQCLQGELCKAHMGIELLKETLASHGITLPDTSSPYSLQTDDSVARVALVGAPGPHQHLQIQTTDRARVSPLAAGTGGSINCSAQLTPQNIMASHEAIESYGSAAVISDDGYNSLRMETASPPGHLDPDMAQFDFILTLERPCLRHVLHPSMPTMSSGHSFTFNAALIASAPSTDHLEQPWSVPTATLERLLELSSTLGVNFGELTPVQAWQRVRLHPKFSDLTQEKLQSLVANLSKVVKCHGFGAVMSENIFNVSLTQALSTSNKK